MSFQTRVASKTCMIVGRPMWRYPIALPKPPPATAPLIEAIRQIDCRPFRVISHAAEDGKVFNASFFHDEKTMHDFGEWYAENALAPGSEHHQCLRDAVAEDTELPTRSDLLFGSGAQVLTDSRFGEYQLGMAVRYSRYSLRSGDAAVEAESNACEPAFEQRIARAMLDAGVTYFGRLVMRAPSAKPASGASNGAGEWVSASRYGSIDDARRGTAVVKAMFAPEIGRWFSATESIIGTASRVLEL